MSLLSLTANVRAQDLAVQADEAYRQSDYATAIDQYEAVLASGYTSANLYYNLGNAYYRSNQMGRAILNYERALRLRPGMKEARENLALAESHTADRIVQLPKLFIVKWIDCMCTHITPSVWRVIWLVLFTLLAASVVVLVLGRSLTLKRTGLGCGIGTLVLLICATLLLLDSTHRYNAHAEAVILDAATTIKGSPEPQSVDKMILHEGTKATIGDSLTGWYKITIADGTTGWCRAESLERI